MLSNIELFWLLGVIGVLIVIVFTLKEDQWKSQIMFYFIGGLLGCFLSPLVDYIKIQYETVDLSRESTIRGEVKNIQGFYKDSLDNSVKCMSPKQESSITYKNNYGNSYLVFKMNDQFNTIVIQKQLNDVSVFSQIRRMLFNDIIVLDDSDWLVEKESLDVIYPKVILALQQFKQCAKELKKDQKIKRDQFAEKIENLRKEEK